MSFWKIFGSGKKTDFYGILLSQSEKTLEGCNALLSFLNGSSQPEDLARIEREADDIRRVLIDELNQTFITPFDREDIFALSRAVDDVLDHAYNTVREMNAFEVAANDHLRQMALLMVKGAEHLVTGMRHLEKNPNVAVQYAVRAKRVENEMNDLFLEALKELFHEPNPRTIIKYREIYRHFNRSADRVDDAANIITNIVVKMF
ncbi:MAG: DUF47 family protein [Desulfomonilaceae bacterium]|nr:DUF47 family protein [Desulfomonilaceae bacterium]